MAKNCKNDSLSLQLIRFISSMSVAIGASVGISAKAAVEQNIGDLTLTYVTKVKVHMALYDLNLWTEFAVGYLALCLDRDNSVVLTLLDCENYSTLMIHEIYYKFDKHFTEVTPTLYCFPSELCIIGLQFTSEGEAKSMANQIAKACPEKQGFCGAVKKFFSRRKMSAKPREMVVSMPKAEKETVVKWNPEKGYEVCGSLDKLPEAHRKFILEQQNMKESGS